MLIALGFLEWGKVLPVLIDSHLPPDRFSGGHLLYDGWNPDPFLPFFIKEHPISAESSFAVNQLVLSPAQRPDNNPDQQTGRESRVGELLDDLIIRWRACMSSELFGQIRPFHFG